MAEESATGHALRYSPRPMNLPTLQTSRACVAALLLSLPLLVAPPAQAQPAVEAATLFRQGKEAYRSGRYPDAYDAYKRAWDIQRGYDIAGNLGNVEVKLGRYGDAVGHLQFVLDHLPPSIKGAKRDRVLRRTQELLQTAKSHVAMVTLDVTPAGATISLDSHVIGTAPLAGPVALDPGQHTLRATMAGHTPLEHPLYARENTRETVSMTMALVGNGGGGTSSGPTAGGAEAVDSGPSTAIVVTGTAIAVVGVGLGAVFLGVAASNDADATALTDSLPEGGCAGDKRAAHIQACSDLDSAVDNTRTFTGLGAGFMIAGGLVGGATLAYALWPRDSGDDGDGAGKATALAPAAVRVSPIVTPGFAGVSVSGTF